MQLIRRFPDTTYAQALAAWGWLPELDGKTPLFTTAFGDVFLQGADGVWLLDGIEGSLTRRWADVEALQGDLNTLETQQDVLMPWLVAAAADAGLEPGPTEILSFRVPQVLSGTTTPENLEVSDVAVALGLLGQIHQQVRDLPPGTPVTGIQLG